MSKINYKSIIKSRATRFAILKFLSFIPDKIMLSIQYYIKLGRRIRWSAPTRFTEKLQLYKTQYRNANMGKCVDKYAVREYISMKGLDCILNGLYGVYDKAEDINFDTLPEKFVIKTTDGGGGNNIVICRNKSKLDTKETISKLDSWLNSKDANVGREWAYTQIEKSRIIVEQFLENRTNPEAGIEDFKILCFNGKPQYIIVDIDRYIEHKRNFYNTKWEKIDVNSDCKQFNRDYPKPDNLDEMLDIAAKLSSEFPFVRVDLYNIDGKIYFGELTFYPWSGYVQFNPDNFDIHLGDLFDYFNTKQ